MQPELRAAADKLIFDVATAKYVASILGKRVLDRRIESLDWTARQLIGHLALSLEAYAGALERVASGEGGLARSDWDAANAEMAAKTEKARLPDLLETMSNARDHAIGALSRMDQQSLSREVREGVSGADVVESCLGHFEEHGLDLADAEPALRRDPMMLNWLLYADFQGQPELLERQERLAADVREWLQSEADAAED